LCEAGRKVFFAHNFSVSYLIALTEIHSQCTSRNGSYTS
jgi:hypothetical protein